MLYKEAIAPALLRTLSVLPSRISNIANKTSRMYNTSASFFAKAAKPIGKATVLAAKVPYNIGRFAGTQLIKRPKATLTAVGAGLLAKSNISKNLEKVNPSYIDNNKISI